MNGCKLLDNTNPALKGQEIDAIAPLLPLANTAILSPDFIEKRCTIIARSRPFRLRKTRAEYDIQLLSGGKILVAPASSLPPQKPIYIGKVTGLEHYPESHKVRVTWEFSPSAKGFEFLRRNIDVFVNKFLKELSILPFTEYISESPVSVIPTKNLTRNQKRRLILWAEQASKKLALPHRAKLLLWARQKNYEEILLYKWGIQDSQSRNCV